MVVTMKKNGVACAIDVNDFDQEVIDSAGAFAKQIGVDLDLVHVSLFPNPGEAVLPGYLGSPNVIIQDNRRFRQVTTNVEGVNINLHHLSGIPTDKILTFIDKYEPQLLVLGTHGRSGLSRIFGSVAAKILRRASCPVMVLRQRQNSQDFADLKNEEAR